MAKGQPTSNPLGQDRSSFAERERTRMRAAEQRARQAQRDQSAIAAKTRGKTQRATLKHR